MPGSRACVQAEREGPRRPPGPSFFRAFVGSAAAIVCIQFISTAGVCARIALAMWSMVEMRLPQLSTGLRAAQARCVKMIRLRAGVAA